MTIKQHGGVFGRNPTFKNVTVEGTLDPGTLTGYAIGTDVQAHDAALDDISGLAVTDGNIIVGDGANWVAESGATARTSLGLAIGSDVQAYDAALNDISGLAVTDGNFIVGDGANWVAESGSTVTESIGLGKFATFTKSPAFTAATDVITVNSTSGGFTQYVFEVYVISAGNNAAAKATIVARGFSGGFNYVAVDAFTAGSPNVVITASTSGADLLIAANPVNSTTVTMAIRSMFKNNVTFSAA